MHSEAFRLVRQPLGAHHLDAVVASLSPDEGGNQHAMKGNQHALTSTPS
jgi:hypothetical protein